MPDDELKITEPLTIWEPEMLRLTLFNNDNMPNEEFLDDHNWWKDVVGSKPVRIENPPNKLWHKEEGPFGNGILVLTQRLERIDWHYKIDALKEMNAGTAAPFTLGDFPSIINTFHELVNKWFELPTCPSASRLAFGTILFQKVDNLQEGNRIITQYLSELNLNLEDTTDFIYRINRPQESKLIPELRINRLATWSVERYFVVHDIVPSGSTKAQQYKFPEQTACKLELDINTTQEYQGILNKEQLSSILKELIESGSDIAKNGDKV